MKTVLKIENLHCAACALELEEELAKLKGVDEVSVDFFRNAPKVKTFTTTSDSTYTSAIVRGFLHEIFGKLVTESVLYTYYHDKTYDLHADYADLRRLLHALASATCRPHTSDSAYDSAIVSGFCVRQNLFFV